MIEFPFSIISGKVVKNIINDNKSEIYELIKSVYIKHEEDNTINPKSYFLNFPDKPLSRIIALPAALKEHPKVAGIKWISSNPLNPVHGFPRASGVIILNDYDTGYPYACIESSNISAIRTVYSAVVAAEYFFEHKKTVKQVGIIGCGLIARFFCECLRDQGWHIEQILVFDKNETEAIKFNNTLSDIIPTAVINSKNYEDVIKKSELLLFSTTSSSPYIEDNSLFTHNPKVLHLSLRDLGVPIILNACNIVDDIEHVLSYNTSVHLAEQACGNRNFIMGTLGKLINTTDYIAFKKPIIFSPMGMGIFDIALGQFIYEKAKAEKTIIEIDNFFNLSLDNEKKIKRI